MTLNTSLLLLVTTLIAGYLDLFQVNALPTLDLYVSKQTTSFAPDGSKENPFYNLSNAFEYIQGLTSPTSDVNILFVPSQESYSLENQNYTINNQYISSIIISTWIDGDINQSQSDYHTRASITFNGSFIKLSTLSQFSMTNINITCHETSISLTNTSLLLQNISIDIFTTFGANLFEIDDVTNVAVTNIDLIMRNPQCLLFYSISDKSIIPNILIQSISVTYIPEEDTVDTSIDKSTLLYFQSTETVPQGVLWIKDVSIDIMNTHTVTQLQPFLYSRGFDSMEISNIDLINQTISSATFNSFLVMTFINSLTISNLTMTNNSITDCSYRLISAINIGDLIISNVEYSFNNITSSNNEASFTIADLSNFNSITITNNSLYNNTFGIMTQYYKLKSSQQDNLMFSNNTALEITGVKIVNNTNLGSVATFSYIYLRKAALKNLTIQDIIFSQNLLTGKTLWFEPVLDDTESVLDLSFIPIPLKITNVTISNNNRMLDTTFLYFAPKHYQDDSDNCAQPSENYLLEIRNLTVTGNNFSQSTEELLYRTSLLNVRQSQVSLVFAVITGNIFEGYGFLNLGPNPSSLFITSSLFNENTIFASQFIVATMVPGYYCSDFRSNDRSNKLTPLYRYSFITNSTFSNIRLSQSVLFTLNNGFLAFHNNTLVNTTLQTSQILVVGFLPYHLKFNSLAYLRHSGIENSTLSQIQPALELFQQVLEKMTEYQSNVVYFASVYQNQFMHINSSNDEAMQLIELSGLNTNQSFIRVEENNFYDFYFDNSMTSDTSSIIYSDSINIMTITNNSLDQIQSAPVFFSLSQAYTSKLLDIHSNTLTNFDAAAFIICTGNIITSFQFNNNTFRSVSIAVSLLYLNVKATTNDWIFKNNSISSTTFLLNSKIFQTDQFGLFALSCDSSLPDNQITWSNTTLTNISIGVGQKGILTDANFLTIQAQQSVQLVDFNAKLINISGSGGLINAELSSSFALTNSTLEVLESMSLNGLIRLIASEIMISNSNFTNHTSLNSYGIFTVPANTPSLSIQILDCSFEKISSRSYGSILTVKPLKLSMASSTESSILSNAAIDQSTLVFKMSRCNLTNSSSTIYLSQINCIDCNITDISFTSSMNNHMINLTENTTGKLTLANTIISSLTETEPVPFIHIKNSTIEVTIDNIFYIGESGNSYIATLDTGSLILKNSIFENFEFSGDGFIEIVDKVPGATFDNQVDFSIPPYVSLHNVTINNFTESSVADDVAPEEDWNWPRVNTQSIINAKAEANILVQRCKFNFVAYLPVILFNPIRTRLNFTPSIILNNSVFQQLFSWSGSVVSILSKAQAQIWGYKNSLMITNCTFVSNFGLVGGAILAYRTILNISNSSFSRNFAQSGESIFVGGSSDRSVFINQTTFLDKDGPQKTPIESEPINFNISFISNSTTGMKLTAARTNDFIFKISNVSHDFSQGILRLDYIDGDLNPASFPAFNTEISIHIENNKQFNLPTEFDLLTVDSTMNSQSLSLDNIVIAGNASDVIEMSLIYNSSRLYREKFIMLYMRHCIPGEYNNSITCEPCLNNTYSLSPHSTCSECPPNANCANQSHIYPAEGFWNGNDQSTVLYKCRPGRCPNDKDLSNCAEGFAGPLCNGCNFDEFYVESGYLKCGKCNDPQKSLLYAILGGIAYFLYQLFSIYVIYTGTTDFSKKKPAYIQARRAERVYYTKTLLTYTQLVSILYLSNYEIYNSLGLTLQAGNPSTLVTYGTQCSMIALGIKSTDFLYYQTVFIVLYPILQFLTISLFASLVTLFKRSINCKRIIAITAFYLIISNQPGIVSSLGLFLSCETLDGLGYKYIVSHPNWSCSTDQYQSFANLFVKPSLTIWSGVIPITLLVILIINRKELDNEITRGSLKVLVSSLQNKYYYWGVVVMILKLTSSLLVFGLEQKSQMQIFLSLILLWTYQNLVRILKPYSNASFNNFDIIMINLLMFNIILVEYLLDPLNERGIIDISSVVGALINVCFLIFVVWKVMSLTFLNVLAFFEKSVMKRKISRSSPSMQEFAVTMLNDRNTVN